MKCKVIAARWWWWWWCVTRELYSQSLSVRGVGKSPFVWTEKKCVWGCAWETPGPSTVDGCWLKILQRLKESSLKFKEKWESARQSCEHYVPWAWLHGRQEEVYRGRRTSHRLHLGLNHPGDCLPQLWCDLRNLKEAVLAASHTQTFCVRLRWSERFWNRIARNTGVMSAVKILQFSEARWQFIGLCVRCCNEKMGKRKTFLA
jgi:hypothetical protein